MHLERMSSDDFELKEILDALNWFGGEAPESVTKEEAWKLLLTLKK